MVGLSILSGSHRALVAEVLAHARQGIGDVPVVVGGIIPPEDAALLAPPAWPRSSRPRTTSRPR